MKEKQEPSAEELVYASGKVKFRENLDGKRMRRRPWQKSGRGGYWDWE
jgi:hypothetical protein